MNASRHLSKLIRTRRGRIATAAASVTTGSLLLASSALANWDTIESGGSPNANSEETLYIIVSWVALFVFLAVEAALVYAIWRFRAKKHPVASQIHGNTKLELGLTASAAGILVILAAATFITLPSIINPPNSDASAGSVLSASTEQPKPPNGQTLTICVLGRQFIWRYVYSEPGKDCRDKAYSANLAYSYQSMTVPAGVTVKLVVQSSDVIHAWWIPKLGGKVDAEPGYTTYTWFKALKAGQTYTGQCAQLCGRGHAFMTATVHTVTPQQYTSWVTNQKQMIAAQNSQVAQLRKNKSVGLTSNGIF